LPQYLNFYAAYAAPRLAGIPHAHQKMGD